MPPSITTWRTAKKKVVLFECVFNCRRFCHPVAYKGSGSGSRPPPPATPLHPTCTDNFFFSTPVLPPISNSRRLQFVKGRAGGLNILIRGRYSFIYGYSLVTEEDRLTVRPTCLTSGILQTMARLFRESTFSFFLEVFLRIVQASHSGCHDRAVTLPSRRITPQNHTPHSGLARGGCPPPRFCGMRTPRSPHQTP